MVDHEGLVGEIRSYLKAEGYQVKEPASNELHASRPALGEQLDRMVVWVPKVAPREFRYQEQPLLRRFGEVRERLPDAKLFAIFETLGGLTSSFRASCAKLDVRLRVPIQLVDNPFSWEISGQTSAATRRLYEEGREQRGRRIAQPFEDGSDSADLHAVLLRRVAGSEAASISVVVGPAGIGKSVLSASLFADLYDRFQEEKKRLGRAPRPLPMLPAHLHGTSSGTIEGILRSFLESDFARPMSLESFKWRVTHDWAVWLIDGLDEVIARDVAFFEQLDDLLTLPGGGHPRVVVFVRESLLDTSTELAEFIEERRSYLKLYRLMPWRDASKRAYARIRFGSRADEFTRTLRSRPTIDKLAELPYYCDLIGDAFHTGQVLADGEVQLLKMSLDKLIDREYEKGLLDRRLIPKGEVLTFAREIAKLAWVDQASAVTLDDLRGAAEVIAAGDMPEEDQRQLAQNLTQLALFARSPGTGSVPRLPLGNRISFTQEIMQQYLLGTWLVEALRTTPVQTVSVLNARELPPDSVAVRVVADWVNEDADDRRRRLTTLLDLLPTTPAQGAAYRNVLLLAATAARGDELRGRSHEGKTLNGIRFADLDLRNVSFRLADLTDTQFVNCRLEEADFSGALLRRTAFKKLSPGALKGALLGRPSRLYSVVTDKGPIGDLEQAKRWWSDQTGVGLELGLPCPPAQQVRHLFRKFVYPNKEPRRKELTREALLRGTRYADVEATFEKLLSAGYLEATGPRERERYARPEAPRYAEIVDYVAELRASPGVLAVLDSLCDAPGCRHVPSP